MTRTILTLRVSRRAIGVAQLRDEHLTVRVGRHLSSRAVRAIPAGTAYIRRMLDVVRPALMVVDAPSQATGMVTQGLLSTIDRLGTEYGIEILRVTKPEVLLAYGLRPVRNRQELRGLVRAFWPELTSVRGQIEPYVVDAAAAALYAECLLALERSTG